ncbi:MAG: endonuclease III domain-containing protein [Planctomycetota bacterium]
MTGRKKLTDIYNAMLKRFGNRNWWPGDSPFEIIVGAVLTQNTAWRNVEKAIANLKRARKLTPRAIHKLKHGELAKLIKPSGYFNVKAKRLKSFVAWFVESYGGDIKNFRGVPTEKLRDELLSVHGIGEETADSILNYALRRKTFVVDAYTKRVFARHGWAGKNASYGDIQKFVMENIPKSLPLYRDFHAQIVAVGNRFCTPKKPKCGECPLRIFLK